MTTIKELIERLQWHNPDEHVAVAIWSVEDVKTQAESRNLKIDDEQAEAIIERIDAKHDASIGISWDTIDCYLDDYDLPEIVDDAHHPQVIQCPHCNQEDTEPENEVVVFKPLGEEETVENEEGEKLIDQLVECQNCHGKFVIRSHP